MPGVKFFQSDFTDCIFDPQDDIYKYESPDLSDDDAEWAFNIADDTADAGMPDLTYVLDSDEEGCIGKIGVGSKRKAKGDATGDELSDSEDEDI